MPGRFHGTLRTTYLNKDWIRSHQCPLDEVQFSYTTSDGREKSLPDHFISDGGSIPRALQNIVRRDELMPAWILHDRDYAIQDISRRLADYDLSEMIYTLTLGYSCVRARVVWTLVRVFGPRAWRYNQSEKRKLQIAAMKLLVPHGDLVFGE